MSMLCISSDLTWCNRTVTICPSRIRTICYTCSLPSHQAKLTHLFSPRFKPSFSQALCLNGVSLCQNQPALILSASFLCTCFTCLGQFLSMSPLLLGCSVFITTTFRNWWLSVEVCSGFCFNQGNTWYQ